MTRVSLECRYVASVPHFQGRTHLITFKGSNITTHIVRSAMLVLKYYMLLLIIQLQL